MKVVWVTPKLELQEGPEGIYSRIASLRYRAIIPAQALAARGHQALVIGLDRECFDSVRDKVVDSDYVVFRKNYDESECTERMLQEMHMRGVKTLFDISDDRFLSEPGPHLRRMIAQAGSVVTTSTMLQQAVKQHTNRDSFVVGDPFEGPRGEARWSPNGSRFKGLWFGHASNIGSLRQALPSLLQAGRKNPIDLRIVTKGIDGIERECKEFNSKHRHALSLRYAKWSIAETWNSLAATDFVIIPLKPDNRRLLAKSTNRIIESLWAGRFVVAHPIPSYMEFKEWAWIGEDLAEGIAWMVEHGSLLAARVRAAQDYIAATYSPHRIALEWEQAFEKT